jgi:hypothetical protein
MTSTPVMEAPVLLSFIPTVTLSLLIFVIAVYSFKRERAIRL